MGTYMMNDATIALGSFLRVVGCSRRCRARLQTERVISFMVLIVCLGHVLETR